MEYQNGVKQFIISLYHQVDKSNNYQVKKSLCRDKTEANIIEIGIILKLLYEIKL